MICIACRLAASFHLDRRSPLPGWVVRHGRHCGPCAGFLETAAELADRLPREAEAPEPADALKTRVMRLAIRSVPATRQTTLAWQVAALAAACVAVLVGLFLFEAGRTVSESEADKLTAVWFLPDAWSESALDNPLQDELGRLKADTEDLAGFLSECIPPPPGPALEPGSSWNGLAPSVPTA